MRPALHAPPLLLAAPAPGRAYDPFEDPPPGGQARSRLLVTGWGGALLGAPGSGRGDVAMAGLEVGWSLESLDLGVQVLGARLDPDLARADPVVLLRLGQRFETRRGLEATFTLGLGAARRARWEPWFQLGLGGRLPLGPLFLAAELGFEQADLIRLAGGVGVRF